MQYDYKAAGHAKRKGKKHRLKDRLQAEEPELENQSVEQLEEELEKEEEKQQQRGLQVKRIRRLLVRSFQILLAILSVYTVFLIYGLMVTEYQYDETGNVKPKIVSVEEIASRKSTTCSIGIICRLETCMRMCCG